MPGTAHDLDHEFWRPPLPSPPIPAVPSRVEACGRCNTEFVVGSRFCHVCGAERDPDASVTGLSRYLGRRFLLEALGLNLAGSIAFALGVTCLFAALLTGLLYTANTLTDWQAVQLWRIEWLLASATAFLAGILLKRPN